MADLLDVIVRFHDTRRLPELSRAVFSLLAQTYRPLRIILVVQRFDQGQVAETRDALERILADDDAITLSILNFTETEPRDARSVLLNVGVRAAQGRYVAFLDYDDVLYPEAYELLVGRLQRTGAAIAFASVRRMLLTVYDQFFYGQESIPPFGGKHLLDLYNQNFCPLHSYVMDRTQIHPDLLIFQPTLTIEEDYDVLLRVCARYKSDFSLVGTQVGDYYYKSDGSNTIPQGAAPSKEMLRVYDGVRKTIERRRRTTIISASVRQQIAADFGFTGSSRPMTIREMLDRFT